MYSDDPHRFAMGNHFDLEEWGGYPQEILNLY